MVDTTWLCRKSKEMLKAIEKRLEELESALAAQACIEMGVKELPRYPTAFATASPNGEFYVKYPSSPKEEGFDEFVKQLPTEALRPHYPTIGELVVKSLEDGGQIPFGLKDIRGFEPKLRVTSRREL